jgi:hypothetical protein
MNRQTAPEQELTTLPCALSSDLASLADTRSNHDATTRRLLDPEPIANIPLSSTRRQNSKIQDFLRHVRLLLPTLPWKTTFEQRKVAVYQSRRMAALNSLLHVIPLAVAGTLLSLYWSKYWVGVSVNTASLQFAAKVHELLMQASLVDILLYTIRSRALNGYLPLGALDFFSALVAPSRAFKLRHKLIFILSTFALLFMTAIVGPSSAILMIPQPGMTHMQNTTMSYLDILEDDLFPPQIENTTYFNM